MYEATYVFDNDFPALLQETVEPEADENANDLFQLQAVTGRSARISLIHALCASVERLVVRCCCSSN